MIDILSPGQKSPFEVFFEYNELIDHYSLNVSSYILTQEMPYSNFTLQDVNGFTDNLGFYHLTGKVNNTGNQVVYWAKVVAIL
ncbi:MAG: hypothetical protein QXP55_04645 [Nitrososphaerales archaeon]